MVSKLPQAVISRIFVSINLSIHNQKNEDSTHLYLLFPQKYFVLFSELQRNIPQQNRTKHAIKTGLIVSSRKPSGHSNGSAAMLPMILICRNFSD